VFFAGYEGFRSTSPRRTLISRLWNRDLCSRSGLRAPRSVHRDSQMRAHLGLSPVVHHPVFISNSTKMKESSAVPENFGQLLRRGNDM